MRSGLFDEEAKWGNKKAYQNWVICRPYPFLSPCSMISIEATLSGTFESMEWIENRLTWHPNPIMMHIIDS